MRYLKHEPLLYFAETAGNTFKWYCDDNKKNYKKMDSPKWHYHNSNGNLLYKFNRLGYRTVELDNLPKDYILVFGCSYTEGVGLYDNEIWCHRLGNELGIPIVNLAKAGTGPDILNFNTQLFIKSNFAKPRAVINQWPQIARKTFGYMHEEGLRLEDRNIHTTESLYDDDPTRRYERLDSTWYFKRWAMEEGQQEYEGAVHINSVTNIWNAYNIPVLNWTFDSDYKTRFNTNLYKSVTTNFTDRARDNAHDGPDIHNQVVEAIRDDVTCMI